MMTLQCCPQCSRAFGTEEAGTKAMIKHARATHNLIIDVRISARDSETILTKSVSPK